MGILELIEASSVGVWIRESTSFFAYTFILTWHAIGLALLCGLHGIMSLRVAGAWQAWPLAPFKKFYPLLYAALAIEVVSGTLLLIAQAVSKLTTAIFWIKLALVAAAVTVLVKMQSRVFSDAALATGTVSAEGRTLAKLAIFLWILTIIVGRLTEYPDLTAQFGL